MPLTTFSWPFVGDFRNRTADLDAIERWWNEPTRDALCVLGRRRVGKSWLFRRFAHDRPAVLLVADRLLLTTQMDRFATELEPFLGVRPALPDLASLLQVLYRLGRTEKVLAVIDEFPYLLPDGAARDAVLTQLQAVMETERETSQTKLVLCGSVVSQMETLLAQSTPLSGRLQALNVWPMSLVEARDLMPAATTADERIERYAVTGGMARHLAELGREPSLQRAICDRILDRRAPLFDDPRTVLMQELRRPATYFSILQTLAYHAASMDHLTSSLGMSAPQLAPYLATLEEMRIVTASQPVGAPATSRNRKYRVDDGFLRFWFRFVFPNQVSLSTGLSPDALWQADIQVHLPDHVSSTFEDLCQRWTRLEYGSLAPNVGSWWGNAINSERRAQRRTVDEVDVVGAQRGSLRVVGECKWTNTVVPLKVLEELRTFKIPAMEQEGRLTSRGQPPQIVLFSRSGFDDRLTSLAATDPQVRLVSADTVVTDLDHGS